MMRHLFLLGFLVLAFSNFAQQFPLLGHYRSSLNVYNPAATGINGITSYTLNSRNQWLGIGNAPRTNLFSFDTRFVTRGYRSGNTNFSEHDFIPVKSGNVGIGAFVYNDHNGHFNKSAFHLNYAYHINDSWKTQYSFGLSGSITQLGIKEDDLYFRQNNDPIVMAGLGKSMFIPDANVGFMLNNPDYFAGFSINQLFQSFFKFGNEAMQSYRNDRVFFIMGGYRFRISKEYVIEPNVFSSIIPMKENSWNFATRFYMKDKSWIGLSYNSTYKSLNAQIGARYEKLFWAYSYEYGNNRMQQYTYGTHEIILIIKRKAGSKNN